MFKQSRRTAAKLKLALTGPSGSGKTWSALSIAAGMCETLDAGKIALVDTENDSASLYSDRFNFDSVNMHSPYLTEKYIQAIEAAEKSGYAVLVIDGLSAQWSDMLDRKAAMDAKDRAGSFYNWKQLTPEHEKLKNKIVSAGIHIIATMRSKCEYVQQQNENGKVIGIQKVGMAPIQRDQLEYEFTSVLDLSQSHYATASKDRTGLFSTTHPFVPSKETGINLIHWLNASQCAVNAPGLTETKAS